MTRQPRKDSKLHSLPPKHRAMVNRWLFDKALTYQQVATACHRMFDLKISRSSVGRYFERETRACIEQKQQAARRAIQQREAAALALLPFELQHRLVSQQMTLQLYRDFDREEKPLPWKTLVKFLNRLHSLRRAEFRATSADLEQKRHDLWTAKQALKHRRPAASLPGSTRVPRVGHGVPPGPLGVRCARAARKRRCAGAQPR